MVKVKAFGLPFWQVSTQHKLPSNSVLLVASCCDTTRTYAQVYIECHKIVIWLAQDCHVNRYDYSSIG